MKPSAKKGDAPRLQPLNTPKPIRVDTDAEGNPQKLYLERQPKQVLSVRERWRIDDEWWRNPISRDYTDLVLENGRVVTVYWDRVQEGWFLQGG